LSMKIIRLFSLCLVLSLLTACGTGEFFIKRAVNGLQDDVADEFKDYADFSDAQERQIDQIAQEVDTWMRRSRLPVLYGELEKMAQDIDQEGQLSVDTWESTVAFLERPLDLSEQTNTVTHIAELAYSMTEEQAEQAIKKLEKDYRKRVKEDLKNTVKKQNKRMARALKILFSELGIGRSKAQLQQAKLMLSARKSHLDLERQAAERDHQTFVNLLRERQLPKQDYLAKFTQAWNVGERGARDQAPQLWQHNAQVAFEVMNFLLSDIDQAQRAIAARKIRNYAALFQRLSETTK